MQYNGHRGVESCGRTRSESSFELALSSALMSGPPPPPSQTRASRYFRALLLSGQRELKARPVPLSPCKYNSQLDSVHWPPTSPALSLCSEVTTAHQALSLARKRRSFPLLSTCQHLLHATPIPSALLTTSFENHRTFLPSCSRPHIASHANKSLASPLVPP